MGGYSLTSDRYPGVQRWHVWIVLGLCAAGLSVFTVGLGEGALRDWDEGTYAQVAREISRSPWPQGWLHPSLGGAPFLDKPPLLLWLIALAYRLGGVSEWTTRLPGALLTACSIPLLYGIGRELFISRVPAILSAGVYLTLFPVVRHGRLAMLDGTAISLFLLQVLCLLRSRRDPRWALGIGLAVGLIWLTKGILALLLGGLALIFLTLDSPRLLRSQWLWVGVLLGNLPVVLWYGVQWQVSGSAVWSYALVEQQFKRIWTPVEGHSGAPWWYVGGMLQSAWPWLAFWPFGLRQAWEHRRESWARLILVWTIGYGLAISVMPTKLPWYVLPLYPSIALAVGVALDEAWQRSGGSGNQVSASESFPRSWGIVLGLVAIAAWGHWVYYAYIGPEQTRELRWSLLAAALTLSVAAVLLRRRRRQFIWVLGGGWYVFLVLYMISPPWALDVGDAYPVKPVATLVREHTVPEQVIYTSFAYSRPSLDFYADRRVVPKSLAELRLLWQHTTAPHLLLDEQALASFNPPEYKVLGEAGGWYLLTRDR